MKCKLIQLVVAVFFFQSLYGQENVGINTNNPTAKLDVNGDVKLGINAQDSADLQILGTSALISLGKGEHGPHGFSFGNIGAKGLQMLYRTTPNRLVIEKGNTFTDSLDLFHLDYDTENSFFKGKMGIGTENPLAKLDISGDLSFGIPTALTPDMKILGTNALISLGENSAGPHGIEFGDNGIGGLQLVYRSNFNRLSIEKSGGFADSTDLFAIDYDTEYGYFHGRVGIGTLSPKSKLDIVGDLTLGIDSPLVADMNIKGTNALISLGKNSVGPHGIEFGDNGVGGLQLVYRSNFNRLSIEKSGGFADSTDLFAIDYDTEYGYFHGRVGIGTLAPVSKLEIQGVQPNHTLTSTKSLDEASGTELISRLVFRGQKNSLYREGAYIEARQDGTWSTINANIAPSVLRFYTQSVESDNDLIKPRMTINGIGNVGIGAISAVSKLEIQGIQPSQTLTSTQNLGLEGGTELISRIVFRGQKNNLYREGAYIEARQDGTWSAGDANFAPSVLRFYTQSLGSANGLSAPRMSIDGSGSVTIGDISPAVGHKLSVDGKVACEEVRVELSQNWPDYVFKHDYNLKSLEEVQLFIKENGHLPGIPSAQQVEDEGIVLGEMNRKMMEKIEELTLYLIDLKKENQALKKRVEMLENDKSKICKQVSYEK